MTWWRWLFDDDLSMIILIPLSSRPSKSDRACPTAIFLFRLSTPFRSPNQGLTKQIPKPVELAELLWAGLRGLPSLRLACSHGLTSDEFRLAQVLTLATTDKAQPAAGK
jgi:hypothetical protein